MTATLIVQASFNVAVTLGLVPTKGITLPFVSYGGSSLIMSMLTAGVLLRLCADALSPVAATSEARRPITGKHVRLGAAAVARAAQEAT